MRSSSQPHDLCLLSPAISAYSAVGYVPDSRMGSTVSRLISDHQTLDQVGKADATQTLVSASYLQAYGPDQIVAYIKPCITSIPINLWGRDFLEQTKATISLNEPF